jgi:two-component system sensor histidine kinase VicK
MGIRAKLVGSFFALLSCAILAVSLLSLDRSLRVMVRGLLDSGDRVAKDTFEQMRGALAAGGADPARALGADRGLRTAMQSSRAFGEYVVYVRIVSADGTVLVAAAPEEEGQHAAAGPGVAELRGSLGSPLPLQLLPALWRDRIYEVSTPVVLNDKPFGAIAVGLSTGLITADVRRLVGTMVVIDFVTIVLSLLAAGALGNQLLGPVQAITSGVEQLATGGEEVPLEIGGSSELGTLASKFNELSRRVRAERTQWENEKGRLVDVFRSIADAVLLLDAEGALLFANDEATGRLGLARAGGKSEGKPLGLLLGAAHPLMQLIAPAFKVGSDVRDVALELPERDGSPARFLVSIFPLGRGSLPAGLLVILRDLAQMRELETVVDYSSRLASLGGLLSGIAHQIRSPLHVMTMQLELLRRENDGAPAQRRIDRVRQEITRLDSTIEALLRFMRPQELKADEVAVDTLLRQLGGRVAQPNVKVDYQLDGALPHITADSGLLTEALQNIVQNGVQAMPQGGVLTLKASRLQDGFVEIEIADRGVGIPEQDLAHIFDLYYTTKDGGSGLGLPLALRAIDLHQGSIKVESQAGVGTTFRIRLPTGAEAKASMEGPRAT